MFSYIAKRLLYFIPTFFIISFVSFGLSKLAPGDPVRLALGSTDSSAGQMTELMAGEQAYYEMAEKMGMNLPSFYFSFSSATFSGNSRKFSISRVTAFLKRPTLYS